MRTSGCEHSMFKVGMQKQHSGQNTALALDVLNNNVCILDCTLNYILPVLLISKDL